MKAIIEVLIDDEGMDVMWVAGPDVQLSLGSRCGAEVFKCKNVDGGGSWDPRTCWEGRDAMEQLKKALAEAAEMMRESYGRPTMTAEELMELTRDK
jgi:hypothetical protein